jgi:hypothetical protein
MYLSGTNTLGFATNSTLDMVLNEAGNLSIGTATIPYGEKLFIQGDASASNAVITTSANSGISNLTLNVDRGLQGGVSIIADKTNQLARIQVSNSDWWPLVFQVRGADGTIERMRITNIGSVGIGATSLGQFSLRISKNIVGAATSYGIMNDGVIQSSVTSNSIYNATTASTVAASFALGAIIHNYANQGTFGAGSTVAVQVGYYAESTLIGAGTNYGFQGGIPAGTNRWNLFMNGTANNYMAGSLGIGSTSIGAKLQVNNAATVGTGSTSMSAINPIIFVDNGNATNGSIVIKSHAVGAGNVVGALRFASSPDGANYNWAGIDALSSASSIVETLSFKIPSSNASAGTSNEIVRIDTNGLSIGTQSATAGTALVVGRNNGRGIYANGTIPSTLTTTARYVNTTAITAAASFNLTNLQHYFAEQGTFGAGSTVTNQYGFFVDSSMTGATNDFGFYGNLAAATNVWNLYMNGTAANYMAGKLLIGSTTDNGEQFQVAGTSRFVGNVSVSGSSSTANADIRQIGFINTSNSANVKASIVAINGADSDIMSLSFRTSTSAINISEKVRIKAQGQMRFVPLAADPSGAEAGDVYYNSTTNKLKVYNGTAWETITSL